MSRNTERIGTGLRSLMRRPYEIVSGKVTQADEGAGTITVQLSDDSEPLHGVKLQAVTGAEGGCLLLPKVDSDVIIGSVDGPGEWVVLQASALKSAKISIGNVGCEITSSKAVLQNDSVAFEIGSSVFKMSTSSESLFDILKELIAEINLLTVATPAGPSGVPNNAANFSSIQARLSNLLTH